MNEETTYNVIKVAADGLDETKVIKNILKNHHYAPNSAEENKDVIEVSSSIISNNFARDASTELKKIKITNLGDR